jgi:hypothetical protein
MYICIYVYMFICIYVYIYMYVYRAAVRNLFNVILWHESAPKVTG